MPATESFEQQLARLGQDPELQCALERRLDLDAADPYRPRYHFAPPFGHMNDPNGFCHWQGRYHLFYQYDTPDTSGTSWGHAWSEDLVRWHDLPIAIRPDAGEDRCYSGQAVVEPGRVVAIYHAIAQGNCIATASDPLLLRMEKHPANPVIPHDTTGRCRVFDPCIWKEEDGCYYSLSGTYGHGADPWSSAHADCRNVFPLFRSRDLAAWEWLGSLYEGGFYTEPGEDGAVPNFWPLGDDKHLLLFFSHKRGAQYYIGDYDRDEHRFHPTSHGRMNYGALRQASLHAPSAAIDATGRLLAIFNVREGKAVGEWSTVMSLPRELSLAADGTLAIRPAIGLSQLGGQAASVAARAIPSDTELPLPDVTGNELVINAEIDPGAAREVGLQVLQSPDREEETRISLYRHTNCYFDELNELQIDLSRSSTRGDVLARSPECGPLSLAEGENLRVQVFIDRSLVEVYANDRQCLTARAYPARPDSTGVSLFARGGAARLCSLSYLKPRI